MTQTRGVVDTSVLVAGLAAFHPNKNPLTASARLLKSWLRNRDFVWLVTEDILDEYKAVLIRLKVRRSVAGSLINLLREEAELVTLRGDRSLSPDPADDIFCNCAEQGKAAFVVTLNPKDFPQKLLRARVLRPVDRLPTTRRRK